MPKVYIAGVGMTRFGKSNLSLLELMAEAVNKAVRDAKIKKPNALYLGTVNPDEFIGESNVTAELLEHLGWTDIPVTHVETTMSTGASTLRESVFSMVAGYYETVVAVAGQKMTHLPTAEVTRLLSKTIDPNMRKYGVTMPALAGLISQRYMYESGIDRRSLSRVAVKNHKNGSFNPHAHFQKEISFEEVESSKMVADPLRLYDVAPISDGAAALVLTKKKNTVRVAGLGHGTDHLVFTERESMTSFSSTKRAAYYAFKRAGRKPKDIDVAELHDAFTPFELITAEDLGFAKPLKAWKLLNEGYFDLDGELPINPSGGLKARGHPIAASGLAQIVELVWQLRGEAGKRQIPKCKIGLAQSTGGLADNNLVTILERI